MKKHIFIASISGLLLGAFIMSLAMYLAGYRVPFGKNFIYDNGTALFAETSIDYYPVVRKDKKWQPVMEHRMISGGSSAKGLEGYAENITSCESEIIRFEYDVEKDKLSIIEPDEEFLKIIDPINLKCHTIKNKN